MILRFGLALALGLAQSPAVTPAAPAKSLLDARRGFTTKLSVEKRDETPAPKPPDHLFTVVKYKGPLGEMSAYVGAPPMDEPDARLPAMLWLTGGFPAGGASSIAWESADPTNDQSASAYRAAGLVMMYPDLRGSGGSPGHQESFFGEVDDVLAALEYLRQVPYVDAKRIYLGGHSTGGTLALLVAECAEGLSGVVALGPVDSPAGYGADSLTYDPAQETENRLRSPIHFLDAIKVPTYVIEGATGTGNAKSVRALDAATDNPAIRFALVEGADHFEVIAPTNAFFAARFAKPGAAAAITGPEIQSAYDAAQSAQREALDLETLAAVRRDGIDLAVERVVQHDLVSRERAQLESARPEVTKAGFETAAIEERKDRKGNPYFLLSAKKKLVLTDLGAVFETSRTLEGLRRRFGFVHNGWFAP